MQFNSSDFHVELLAFPERQRKAGQQLRDLFEVCQAHDLDGRVHVAVRQADEHAGELRICFFTGQGPERCAGERPITLAELRRSPRIFLLNSVRGIWPVEVVHPEARHR